MKKQWKTNVSIGFHIVSFLMHLSSAWNSPPSYKCGTCTRDNSASVCVEIQCRSSSGSGPTSPSMQQSTTPTAAETPSHWSEPTAAHLRMSWSHNPICCLLQSWFRHWLHALTGHTCYNCICIEQLICELLIVLGSWWSRTCQQPPELLEPP